MSSALTEMPFWNPRATAEERFTELVRMAQASPDKFEHVVVGYCTKIGAKEGDLKINYTLVNLDLMQLVGLLRAVEDAIFKIKGFATTD